MPEGDTVARTAARLHAAFAGQPLVRCDLRWGSLATRDLTGAVTLEVVARGKHLLHRFDTGLTLHSHLRMEGQWRVLRTDRLAGAALRRHDVRAVLGAATWSALGTRLGMLDLVPTADEHLLVGRLGPDILDPNLDLPGVAAAVGGDPRPLGEVLLDQRVLAGIGTFWSSEGLFLQRLNPWRPARDVPPAQIEELLRRIARLMHHATDTGWQSSTGSTRPGDDRYVHARSGRPCRRCGDTVRVAVIGEAPKQRTLFSCPTCQGGHAPGDDGRAQAPLGSRSGRGAGGTGGSRSARAGPNDGEPRGLAYRSR